MSDAYQLFIVAGMLLTTILVIAVVLRMQQMGDVLRLLSDSQNDITRTQQVIAQTQKEQTAILQHLVTQVSVMDARQEGWRPNE